MKMPLRHKSTKIHKEQSINILFLVIPLCLRAFVATKAIGVDSLINNFEISIK
jgi:hypothetical protein